MFIWTD